MDKTHKSIATISQVKEERVVVPQSLFYTFTVHLSFSKVASEDL